MSQLMAKTEARKSAAYPSDTFLRQHLSVLRAQNRSVPRAFLQPMDPSRKLAVDFGVVADLTYPANALCHRIGYNSIGCPPGSSSGESVKKSTPDTQLCRAKRFLARAKPHLESTRQPQSQIAGESCRRVSQSAKVSQTADARQDNGGGAIRGHDLFPSRTSSNVTPPDSVRLLWEGTLWWQSIEEGLLILRQVHCRISWDLLEEYGNGSYTLSIPANAKLCLLSNAILQRFNPACFDVEGPRMQLGLFSLLGKTSLRVLSSTLDYGKHTFSRATITVYCIQVALASSGQQLRPTLP